MASGGAEEDDGGTSLDIDNVHMLLQGQSVQRHLRRTATPRGGPCRGDVLSLVHHFDVFMSEMSAVALLFVLCC